MSRWAFAFLPCSLVAAFIGFGEAGNPFAVGARMLFFLLLFLSLVSLISIHATPIPVGREVRRVANPSSFPTSHHDPRHLDLLRGVILFQPHQQYGSMPAIKSEPVGV